MSKTTPANPDPARPLPERVNLEHLKKEAKQRLRSMRLDNPGVTLSAVQLTVAREYGFSSWRSLIAYVKSRSDKKSQLLDRLRAASAKTPLQQALLDGLEAVGKGDYQTAVAHFRRALRERPMRIRAHYYLGRALIRLQLYREALTAFEELLKFDPENLPAHYEIGKLYLTARNYPRELLSKFDPENLLVNYEIGAQYLSPQNYADAVAKYQWLRSQSKSSKGDSYDSNYELLPDEPRAGSLAQNPFHRANAAELAHYLLDLFPPQVAERYRLPYSKIIFDVPSKTPQDPNRKRQDTLIDDQPEALKPVTIWYKEAPQYTEIASINRLEGAVVLSAFFMANGGLSDIKVVRGLPDGLTRRAINTMKRVRFTPASLNGAPVGVRENVEFDFKA